MTPALRSEPDHLTIVGDDAAGVLAAALRRLGPNVQPRTIADLCEGEGPVLAIGIAAADGGATVRRRIGPRARLVVVLPREDVSARLEAFRQDAAVVTASLATETAAMVVEQLEEAVRPSDLGRVELGALMRATRDRLAARVGSGRAEDVLLELGDGKEIALAIDAFADALAGVCSGTRARRTPSSRPPPRLSSPPSGQLRAERGASERPSVSRSATLDLDWEDDPQTMEADAAEVERFRQLTSERSQAAAAGGAEVLGTLKKRRPSGEIPAADLWAKSDSEPPAREDHRPLMELPPPSPRRREPSGVVPTQRARAAASPSAVVPTTDAPTAGAPTAGAPTAGVPTAGAPTAGASTAGVPIGGVPIGVAPIGAVPIGVAPIGAAPVPVIDLGEELDVGVLDSRDLGPGEQGFLDSGDLGMGEIGSELELPELPADDVAPPVAKSLPAVIDPDNVATSPQRPVSRATADEVAEQRGARVVDRWAAEPTPAFGHDSLSRDEPLRADQTPARRSPLVAVLATFLLLALVVAAFVLAR